MGDIVATIQREQDEIIRSPLPGVLVVQGGPGTGKTAVALHRAAYLLYTHRFPLERQGVLVVGPNPLFLRYIEQVLPSLGETGVSLSTVSGLVSEVRVRGVDDPAVASLKGDARMVKVVARAVRTRQRPLRRDVAVPFGAGVLRLRASSTEEIVALARRRPGTHNSRRRFVESQVLRVLVDEYLSRLERGRGNGSGADDVVGGTTSRARRADASRARRRGGAGGTDHRLRRTPEVMEALNRMWPRLSPHELVHDLLGARPLLSAAGKGILTADEVQRLYRPRSATLDAVAWTAGDAALVDEARAVLGPRRGRGRGVPAPPAARRGRRARWDSGRPGSPPRRRPDRRPRDFRRFGRGRGGDPLLRPHRGRRGAGPLAHAAANAGAPIALGLHDGGGGHCAGDRAVGPDGLGRGDPSPEPATAAPPRGADGELPHTGRGHRAGGAGPGAWRRPASLRRARYARRAGSPSSSGPPGRLSPPPRRSWPRRRWLRWRRAGWRSWGPLWCCPR